MPWLLRVSAALMPLLLFVACGASGGDETPSVGGAPSELRAFAANSSVGLEWAASAGATGYRLYWGDSPGFALSSAASFEVTAPAFVHRGLQNGTTYHYVVTALGTSGDSAPSSEVNATPGGEWVLEELGTGLFDDVLTGASIARVPIEKRIHILLVAEGYTESDLAVFHTQEDHDGPRAHDVDRWVDLIFGIEPYSQFRDAFVVWYLPRASNAHIGGDTAFAVPITFYSDHAAVAGISKSGETASRAWQALAIHPFPPVDFYSSSSARAKNHVPAFLIFDPNRGRASVSGVATSLVNPDNPPQRVVAAFGVGHAHEFSHAMGQLRDEYLTASDTAPTGWGPTSNVVPTSRCQELPWSHLVLGGAHNPHVHGLVGAFGAAEQGFHSELVCLMNGTQDNAQFFGGSGYLRVARFCNFCREMVTYRIFERTQVLANDVIAFDTWRQDYRSSFYARHGFSTPSVIPQTNDAQNPTAGTAIFMPCTAESTMSQPAPAAQ